MCSKQLELDHKRNNERENLSIMGKKYTGRSYIWKNVKNLAKKDWERVGVWAKR